MQTDYNNALGTSPAFGSVNLISGSKDILKAKLKTEDLMKFSEMADKYADDIVDINFFGRGIDSKKLDAKIISNKTDQIKLLSQGLFESTMSFINRCFKQAGKIKVAAKDYVDPDEILKRF